MKADTNRCKAQAAVIAALVCGLVWTPSFAQEGERETPDGGQTLQKKQPLTKKVLEKKAPADTESSEAGDASGLSGEDLFGVDEVDLAPENDESLVDDVEVLEEEIEAPTVLELLEAKKARDPRSLDLWEKFLLHLKEEGHEEVIEEMGLNDVDNPVDFTRGDPIRGTLFRISGDLLRLDTMFQQAAGTALEGARRERALAAAKSLRDSDDPYLKVYGDYYQARLEYEAAIDRSAEAPEDQRPVEVVQPEAVDVRDDLSPDEAVEAGKPELVKPRISDAAALDRSKELFLALTESEYFLPQEEARRYLADIYLALDDPTLAILEWQLYLTELPVARESERTVAEEEIRKIRESTQHPGPLRESVGRMRLVSGRLGKGDVTEPTQTEEVRLEDVLEKIAKLLEKAEQAGSQSMSMQGQASMRSQLTRGQRQRQAQSQQLQQLARNRQQGQQRNGQNQQNQPNNRQNRDKQQHAGGQEGKTALKDVGDKDREKWGSTNLRDVATSLKGVWDKIPVTYRQLVTQYFRDISDLEPESE